MIILDALESLRAVSAGPKDYELVLKLKVMRRKANKLIYQRQLCR